MFQAITAGKFKSNYHSLYAPTIMTKSGAIQGDPIGISKVQIILIIENNLQESALFLKKGRQKVDNLASVERIKEMEMLR
jgi:hypothetical protein